MSNSAPSQFQALAHEHPDELWAAINSVADETGWKSLMSSAYALLGAPDSKHLWPIALEVVTCGADNKTALPDSVHECIARIYFCIDQIDELDTVEMDEQVWAFVSKWLGLPYTSDWSPSSDPEVSKRMARMHREAGTVP